MAVIFLVQKWDVISRDRINVDDESIIVGFLDQFEGFSGTVDQASEICVDYFI